jgi:glycosyltransferase involved in cell wall biosynthesis
MNILHLSHTDVHIDSRILKEVIDLNSHFTDFTFHVVGIRRSNIVQSFYPQDIHSISLDLISRKLLFFPVKIRQLFVYLEFLCKVLSLVISHRPTLIHCHDTFALTVGYIASLFFNTKLVYDAHELESNKNSQSRVSSFFTFYFEKLVFSQISLLIVVSESIERWYLKNFKVCRSLVIYNSPYEGGSIPNSLENFNDHNYLREYFSIPNSCKIYVYVGMLMPGRGIELILSVFQNPQVSDYVIFIGDGVYDRQIANVSKKYSNVHLHKSVPHNLLVDMIQTADYGLCLIENVSLSDYYSLPNKLFEFAFSGLRIIGSDFPEISKFLLDHNLGTCCSHDHDNLLDLVLSNPSPPTISNAYDLSTFSWASQIKKLTCSYEQILN